MKAQGAFWALVKRTFTRRQWVIGSYASAVTVLAIVAAIWGAAAWYSSYRLTQWAWSLGNIGFALNRYADDHAGSFPSSVVDLYPGYVALTEIIDPMGAAHRREMVDLGYAYVGGLRSDDPGDCPVLVQLPQGTRGKYVVVYKDCHFELQDYAYVVKTLQDPSWSAAVLGVKSDGLTPRVDAIKRKDLARRVTIVRPSGLDLSRRLADHEHHGDPEDSQ